MDMLKLFVRILPSFGLHVDLYILTCKRACNQKVYSCIITYMISSCLIPDLLMALGY